MKYYKYKQTNILLVDDNNTAYLKGNGYTEISKNEYDRLKEINMQKHREKIKERRNQKK